MRAGAGIRFWAAASLAAIVALAQGCGVVDQLMPPQEFKPIVNTPHPAETPPPPIFTPATATTTLTQTRLEPAEIARPGNPMSWGDAGKIGVGREFDAIYFNGQSTELDPVAKGRLNAYAAWLSPRQQVWLTLAGHADRHGSDEYAYNLGMARALAVADYLAGRGIVERRLFMISYGKDRPVAEGKDAEADALNNRVEVLGFVAPLGQEAPAPAGQAKGDVPEAEKAPPGPLGREL